MNLQSGRMDIVVAAGFGAILFFLGGHFAAAPGTIERQRDVAIILPTHQAAQAHDPDAGDMDAEPDRQNWDPADGEAHYGDKSGSKDDQDDDDDDDLDSSYDPPGPDDTTPI